LAAVADINGDGFDEVELLVSEGAATEVVEILELPIGEAGPIAYTVRGPSGVQGFTDGQAAQFTVGTAVTHSESLTCATSDQGAPQVYSTLSESYSSPNNSEWTTTLTTFVVDETRFKFVRAQTSTSPADAASGPPPPPGTQCFPEGF